MKEKIILSPIQIGPVTVKNRVIFPSMCTFFCDEMCIRDRVRT